MKNQYVVLLEFYQLVESFQLKPGKGNFSDENITDVRFVRWILLRLKILRQNICPTRIMAENILSHDPEHRMKLHRQVLWPNAFFSPTVKTQTRKYADVFFDRHCYQLQNPPCQGMTCDKGWSWLQFRTSVLFLVRAKKVRNSVRNFEYRRSPQRSVEDLSCPV